MWHRCSSLPIACLLSIAATPAAAQVEITVHGGLHRAAGVSQAREQPSSTTAGGSSRLLGEATTAGARIGVGLSDRWQIDGGVAWSRSSNWEGAVSRSLPSFEAGTLFIGSTVQGFLTEPDARLGVFAGAGPALIIERGHGTSTDRRTNLGGMLAAGAVMRLDHQFSVRLDAQQYLFSSVFEETYTPHLGLAPIPHASRLRHDFVLLAGFSWRSD
jgi:Outer membrane protein beta-barrel domain